jgi:rhodanese-related sulfurtransferase
VTHPSSGAPAIPEVPADEARARSDAGAVVLDVREPDEWHAGHVEGAVWIPMAQIAARHEEVPRDRPVLVICRSGHRSGRAVAVLVDAGVDALNVVGGMKAWHEQGFPIVREGGGPGTVA